MVPKGRGGGGDGVTRRGASRTHRRPQGDEETVGVRRDRDRDHPQGVQIASSWSTAASQAPRWACARVANADQRIAACLQRSKRTAGRADAAVRHGRGWPHHPTRAFLATWCLERAIHRGKNMDHCDPMTADVSRHRHERARGIAVRDEVA